MQLKRFLNICTCKNYGRCENVEIEVKIFPSILGYCITLLTICVDDMKCDSIAESTLKAKVKSVSATGKNKFSVIIEPN